MLDIWFKSIARAGGIETPAHLRIVEARPQAERAGSLKLRMARKLRHAGQRLLRAADLLGPEPAATRCG